MTDLENIKFLIVFGFEHHHFAIFLKYFHPNFTTSGLNNSIKFNLEAVYLITTCWNICYLVVWNVTSTKNNSKYDTTTCLCHFSPPPPALIFGLVYILCCWSYQLQLVFWVKAILDFLHVLSTDAGISKCHKKVIKIL